MRRLVLVPVALVVFALLSQAGLKTRLYIPAAVALAAEQDGPAAASSTASRAGASGPAESFEVASVKANKSGDNRVQIGGPGTAFRATNVALRMLITVAYRLQPSQLVGGPDWISTDRFDILAKPPDGVSLRSAAPGTGPAPLQLMLRALLADRFKLKVHNESRELPVYALVLARSDGTLGPKMERSEAQCAAGGGRGRPGGAPQGPPTPPKAGEHVPCSLFMMPGAINAGDQTMAQFATALSQRPEVGRQVIDRTGLDGLWSYDVEFAFQLQGQPPPGVQLPPVDPNAPNLFTALQEQLGLKLESTKAPVDVLVIDSVDHPTDD